jgi:hypothetical protein
VGDAVARRTWGHRCRGAGASMSEGGTAAGSRARARAHGGAGSGGAAGAAGRQHGGRCGQRRWLGGHEFV